MVAKRDNGLSVRFRRRHASGDQFFGAHVNVSAEFFVQLSIQLLRAE